MAKIKLKQICISLLTAASMLVGFSSIVHADIGDNIGGGSGEGGGAATDSRYTYFYSNPQGYRVTLISSNGQTKSGPIDIVNSGNDENYAKQVKRHFGKMNKLSYMNGDTLFGQSSKYTYSVLAADVEALPDFLAFNIEAVKSWFTTGKNIKWLCQSDKLNFDFTKLTNSPDYKLLVEPVVYVKIPLNNSDTNGSIHAMTATEGTLAASKDKQVNYNLFSVLRTQVPISMFLEFDDYDVGISAYTGKTDWGDKTAPDTSTALQQLGVGIIYFTGTTEPPDPPDPPDPPEPGGYAYDFIANSVFSDTSPIREENDFDATANFTYQQKIDCKYCATTCPQCGLSGSYTVLIQNGYYAHWSGCSVFNGMGCDCGMIYIPPVYETRRCNLCYINCAHCDYGELWYKSSLSGEYTAPTKSAEIQIFVEGATLDYTKGIQGVLKYTTTVNFTADKPMEIQKIMNAGERIGGKVLAARINWNSKGKESNPNNNEKRVNINVIPATNLQIEYLLPNAPYRTGTEVVTSYLITNKDNVGALNVRPKHNLAAVFTAASPGGNVIAEKTFNNIVIPKNGTNLIYFKWLLPEDYNSEEIELSCSLNKSQSVKEMDYNDNIADSQAVVQIFKEQIPPDTVFENKPIGFVKPSAQKETPTSKWTNSVINSVSYERWEWSGDYQKNRYTLSLDADYETYPDEKSPSRKKLNDKFWYMRSGYGVFLNITPIITSNLPQGAYTPVQNGNAYLPEYQYLAARNGFRTLNVVNGSLLFPENPNTITDRGEQDYKRLHFTPLWYPDGDYLLKTYIYDCWTPVGMLSKPSDVNQLEIKGDMYEDWYLSHAAKQED